MLIPFSIIFLGIGYLCYQAKEEVYLIEKESLQEKDDVYKGLDDLFIWIIKIFHKHTLSINLLGQKNNYSKSP